MKIFQTSALISLASATCSWDVSHQSTSTCVTTTILKNGNTRVQNVCGGYYYPDYYLKEGQNVNQIGGLKCDFAEYKLAPGLGIVSGYKHNGWRNYLNLEPSAASSENIQIMYNQQVSSQQAYFDGFNIDQDELKENVSLHYRDNLMSFWKGNRQMSPRVDLTSEGLPQSDLIVQLQLGSLDYVDIMDKEKEISFKELKDEDAKLATCEKDKKAVEAKLTKSEDMSKYLKSVLWKIGQMSHKKKFE